MSTDRRIQKIALPLALLGLGIGVLLMMFDPVMIARRVSTSSVAKSGGNTAIPVPLTVRFTDDEIATIRSLAPLPATPEDPTNAVALSPRAAWLGQALFYEPRLSSSGNIHCGTCHDPSRWFVDLVPVAEGLGVGTRNTPTVLHTAHSRWFGWDGRADSLWSMSLLPIENDVEMGGNRVAIVRMLENDPELRMAYEATFGPIPPLDGTKRNALNLPREARPVPEDPQNPLNTAWEAMREASRDTVNRIYANIGKALAAYQSLLNDGGSTFDRFVLGLSDDGTSSTEPMSEAELRGLKLFIGKAGCIDCHTGPMFTDEEFHNIGVPPRDGKMPRDSGRYKGVELLKRSPFHAAGYFSDGRESARGIISEALVNSPENWGRFKTPSLRSVVKTPPYMHGGQFNTLDEVVRFYSTLEGAVQLDHHQETMLEPLNLTDDEIRELVAFLGTLHGPGPSEELMGPPRRPFGGVAQTRSNNVLGTSAISAQQGTE
jgi:cytochrome c peroxidase